MIDSVSPDNPWQTFKFNIGQMVEILATGQGVKVVGRKWCRTSYTRGVRVGKVCPSTVDAYYRVEYEDGSWSPTAYYKETALRRIYDRPRTHHCATAAQTGR